MPTWAMWSLIGFGVISISITVATLKNIEIHADQIARCLTHMSAQMARESEQTQMEISDVKGVTERVLDRVEDIANVASVFGGKYPPLE